MQNSQQNNKRIAKNTILLYVRMILVMGVTLYTSRIILRALGVSDYGIYNVVGGVVSGEHLPALLHTHLEKEIKKNYRKSSIA